MLYYSWQQLTHIKTLESNCCNANLKVGRCCMTYGLEVHMFYVLFRLRTLSDWEVGGLKMGLYCTFCLSRKAWVGSLCESGDLTLAKSNQTFWGLTGPIRQRWLPLTSWAQFKAFADKEKRHCLWENTRRRRRYDNLWQPFMSIVSTKNTLLHHFDTFPLWSKKGSVKRFCRSYIKHRHDLLNDLSGWVMLVFCFIFQLFRWKHGVMASPVSSNLTRNLLTSTKDSVQLNSWFTNITPPTTTLSKHSATYNIRKIAKWDRHTH